MNNNIMLIGFMGTGKSTVSKSLSMITRYVEIDLDDYIEKKQNRTINEIFAEDGESEFRKIETLCLGEVCSRDELIISCGGGTVIKDENVEMMKKSGKIVLLTARPETIYNRVKDSTNRPILNGNMNVEYIEGLMKKREEFYLRTADIIIETDDKSAEEISREILEKIKKNG